MEPELRRVLAEMRTADPERADLAEAAVEWLTAGEGTQVIDLARIQYFAWYELPTKWLVPPDEHRAVLVAAGDVLDRLGMARYAAVCRSAVTAQIQDAYVRSRRAGLEAFRAAYRRSGIEPSDLGDFAWGSVMGHEEADARAAVERALEKAMIAGPPTPGTRGWKSLATQVTIGVLDSPHPHLPGQSLRTAILTERLETWLSGIGRRSPVLHDLRSRHVNRLLHPIPCPEDVPERMAPLIWFLDRVDGGVALTQAGYLPTSLVREGWTRFGWDLGWTDRAPRSESELGPLFEVHELARRLGAVTRRGGRLSVSHRGRFMRVDPESAWRTVAAGLSPGDWARAVAEAFTLMLLEGEQDDEELERRAVTMLDDSGWRLDGQPPGAVAVMSAWWATGRILGVLGGTEKRGRSLSRTTRLTAFGEATLLEQIRANAVGPRTHLW